jgi:hypothetical protein
MNRKNNAPMAEQEAPEKFQHVDGGLTKQLQQNVTDSARPMMERAVSAMMLIGARALLEQINNDGLLLPGTAPQPDALPSELPSSRALLPKD